MIKYDKALENENQLAGAIYGELIFAINYYKCILGVLRILLPSNKLVSCLENKTKQKIGNTHSRETFAVSRSIIC